MYKNAAIFFGMSSIFFSLVSMDSKNLHFVSPHFVKQEFFESNRKKNAKAVEALGASLVRQYQQCLDGANSQQDRDVCHEEFSNFTLLMNVVK